MFAQLFSYLNTMFIRNKSLQPLAVHHLKSLIGRCKQCYVGEVHGRIVYHLRENAEIWVASQNGLKVAGGRLQDSVNDVNNSVACTLVCKNNLSSLDDNCLSLKRRKMLIGKVD